MSQEEFRGEELVASGYEVMPAQNESFVIIKKRFDEHSMAEMWAFSGAYDLINFLNLIHRGNIPVGQEKRFGQ